MKPLLNKLNILLFMFRFDLNVIRYCAQSQCIGLNGTVKCQMATCISILKNNTLNGT